jgi:hypothetical protein
VNWVLRKPVGDWDGAGEKIGLSVKALDALRDAGVLHALPEQNLNNGTSGDIENIQNIVKTAIGA